MKHVTSLWLDSGLKGFSVWVVYNVFFHRTLKISHCCSFALSSRQVLSERPSTYMYSGRYSHVNCQLFCYQLLLCRGLLGVSLTALKWVHGQGSHQHLYLIESTYLESTCGLTPGNCLGNMTNSYSKGPVLSLLAQSRIISCF